MFAAPLFAGLLLLLSFVAAPASAGVFVDSLGRTVEIPANVERVLPAGPPAAVILYTLAPDRLVGWVQPMSDADLQYLAAPYRDLPIAGRLTGRDPTLTAEDVRALKPDLIVDVGTVDAAYGALADRIQAETGIPYVVLDGSLDRTPILYLELGAMLGTGERAAELADASQALLDRWHVAPAADGALSVYYGRGETGLRTDRVASISNEILAVAGLDNVAAIIAAEGNARVAPTLVAYWNPDAILLADPAAMEAVLSDRLWQGVPAVQAGRVYVAPSGPWGWIDTPPGVNRLIGLAWLATILDPAGDWVALEEATRDFYQTFYGVALSDDELRTLLGS